MVRDARPLAAQRTQVMPGGPRSRQGCSRSAGCWGARPLTPRPRSRRNSAWSWSAFSSAWRRMQDHAHGTLQWRESRQHSVILGLPLRHIEVFPHHHVHVCLRGRPEGFLRPERTARAPPGATVAVAVTGKLFRILYASTGLDPVVKNAMRVSVAPPASPRSAAACALAVPTAHPQVLGNGGSPSHALPTAATWPSAWTAQSPSDLRPPMAGGHRACAQLHRCRAPPRRPRAAWPGRAGRLFAGPCPLARNGAVGQAPAVLSRNKPCGTWTAMPSGGSASGPPAPTGATQKDILQGTAGTRRRLRDRQKLPPTARESCTY